jgi:hypothetical protein
VQNAVEIDRAIFDRETPSFLKRDSAPHRRQKKLGDATMGRLAGNKPGNCKEFHVAESLVRVRVREKTES